MIKKKSKKRRNSKTAEKPLEASDSRQKLISEEEWLAREQRCEQRIQDVKVCLGFISESIEDYNMLLEQQSKDEHWNRYISCDGLPRVQFPPELRCFLTEIRHCEAKNVNGEVNWALSVDETSILSQDIFRKDLTRKELEQNLRPNIGALYDNYVNRILIVLDRIELLLASTLEMTEVPHDRALEITIIRDELNKEIDALFDKLTYRVVSAPSSFKTSCDGIVESYCYKSSNYNVQIWWLSDVPVRFDYLELPLMLAELDCVGVEVQIPLSVLCDNLTLRCVHTFFDPYSENAKSYEQVIDKSTDHFNAGIMDIEDCLINEWLMQVGIMNQMITKMEMKIQRYEEQMREIEAKLDQQTKADRGKNKIRPPSEPQRLPEGMFPDPYAQFLEQEQQEYLDFLNEFLNPANLKLSPDEVNLRRYHILGGIYSLLFVRKPKHTDFQKFNMTLHEDGRVLYTMHDVCAHIEEEQPMFHTATSVYRATQSRSTHRLEPINPLQLFQAAESPHHLKLHLDEKELPYFFVSFALPEHLCRFGEPLACQFIEEEVEEEDQEPIVTIELEEIRLKKRKIKKPQSARSQKSTVPSESVASKKTKRRTNDDPRSSELRRPRRTTITQKRDSPRNLYHPSVLSMLRRSTVRTSILPGCHLRDFALTGRPLSTMHMHDVTKHCIPRMLSSFKFPLEFQQEKRQEIAEKQQGSNLLRRHVPEVNIDNEEVEGFNYEKQEGPERMYPVFDWREKVLYDQETSSQTESLSESELRFKVVKVDQIDDIKPIISNEICMFGVMQTLEDIQGKYRARPKTITQQRDFVIRGKAPRPSAIDNFDVNQVNRQKNLVRISALESKISPQRPSRGSHFRSSIHGSEDTLSMISNTGDATRLPMIKGRDYYQDKPELEKELTKVKHWTTKYIHHTNFNAEKLTLTIRTDRLGLFGFAYKRYAHFPFRDWSLQLNESNPNEIIFQIDTHYVRIFLFITNEGIRGYVTKITEEYVARPVKYMEIETPISDYREIRRRFCEKNINIFAEHDASYYIENGYFSEKHLASELHVYDAFAVHCKLIKFFRSDWNRLATRRNILLCLRNPKDLNEGAEVTVRVTPDSSTFVEVTELCSDDLDVFNLNYQLTWRNIGVYSDLHQLINSMYPQATDMRNRDPKLIYYIRKLFTEVRPLSFS